MMTIEGFKCYLGTFDGTLCSIILSDLLPIPQAEYAAHKLAGALKSSEIQLEAVKIDKGIRYGVKILNVKYEEVKKWLQ